MASAGAKPEHIRTVAERADTHLMHWSEAKMCSREHLSVRAVRNASSRLPTKDENRIFYSPCFSA